MKAATEKYLEAELHKRKLAESRGIVNCTKERDSGRECERD